MSEIILRVEHVTKKFPVSGASVTLDPIVAPKPPNYSNVVAAFQRDEKFFVGGLELILCLK